MTRADRPLGALGWRDIVISLTFGLGLVLLGAALGGCRGGDAPVDQPAAERTPGPGVSAELVAALEAAQNLHHRADVLLREGQRSEAVTVLEQILTVPFPAGAAEAEDVRIDARARLGLLLADLGRLDDAERVVDEGLRGATRDSYFLANLYRVRGKLHEARATAAAAGTPAAADELRRAITAYKRGQDINVRVQARVYEETLP